ncbi:MAG: 50S ribosome-binding GTPase [Candidatus Omnitrophica bacterium]|nr:50S ribosome-binding GTPase [Candidatus Omnitrophota bacterium]
MDRQLSIILTGELDSGKSTLIGRLLFDTHSLSKESEKELRNSKGFRFASLLDSLQEERDGEFTLDTTQAVISSKKIQYTLIDAPGHKELIKNMLTASSYAEAAIVVIDAEKGLEEQTKRHTYILKFLGIDSMIIVINKMDSVGYKKDIFFENSAKASYFLKNLGVTPVSIIPISAEQGDCLLKRSKNMPWYQTDCLMESIDKCVKQKKNSDFRLPIQDIYNIGDEAIIVGRIVSGKIRLKDKIKSTSFNKNLRIKCIKTFGKKNKLIAKAPESIGLVLDDIKGLGRGNVLYKGIPPEFKKQVFAKIFCVRPLLPGERFSFLCSTQEVLGKISEIKTAMETTNFTELKNPDVLNATDTAEVTIDLEKSISVESFKRIPALGRFLLQKNSKVCAVGIIL